MASVTNVVCALAFFLLMMTRTSVSGKPRYPVILVPGDGGSQLWAKLDKNTSSHYFCQTHTADYFNIWLNLGDLIYPSILCFVENMMLHYNNTTHTTYNTEGVDIRIQNFGDPRTVEWLDADERVHYPAVSYFSYIADALVSYNFTRGKDLKGAPFDFRKAPNELGDFFQNLTGLIESTYYDNNNTPVVMVGHSMGNPVLLYYLNRREQAWKDKFMKAFVSLAGVWGGAVKPVRLMCSGDALGVVIVYPRWVRAEQRSMPSTAWLMPSPKLWSKDEVLVITEKRNYTVEDYKDLFMDLDFMDGYYMRQDVENLIIDLTAPGVEMHCLHGLGLHTPGQLKFGPNQFPDTFPDTIPDDGDGTVNVRSLEACKAWSTQQKQPVIHKVIEGAEHMAILSDPTAIQYIVDLVTGS